MTTPHGLEAVFLANRPALLRYLNSRLRNQALAEDLAQDLWIKLAGLEAGPISDPLAYLYRMAENLARDRQRSAVRRDNRESEWTRGQIDGTLVTAIDPQPSPERILIGRHDLRRVLAAIETLPERTAYIFRAARFDTVPQKEIAAQLGISLRAVEKHLQRAYRLIFDLLHSTDTVDAPPQRHEDEGSDHAQH